MLRLFTFCIDHDCLDYSIVKMHSFYSIGLLTLHINSSTIWLPITSTFHTLSNCTELDCYDHSIIKCIFIYTFYVDPNCFDYSVITSEHSLYAIGLFTFRIDFDCFDQSKAINVNVYTSSGCSPITSQYLYIYISIFKGGKPVIEHSVTGGNFLLMSNELNCVVLSIGLFLLLITFSI